MVYRTACTISSMQLRWWLVDSKVTYVAKSRNVRADATDVRHVPSPQVVGTAIYNTPPPNNTVQRDTIPHDVRKMIRIHANFIGFVLHQLPWRLICSTRLQNSYVDTLFGMKNTNIT